MKTATLLLRPVEAELVRLAEERFRAATAVATAQRAQSMRPLLAEYGLTEQSDFQISQTPEGLVLRYVVPPEPAESEVAAS